MPIDKTDLTKQHARDDIRTYFANLPTTQCANECWFRIEEYYNEMRRTGRLALYRNAYVHYFMGWIYRASMYKSGEVGELTRSFWNHARNIILHLISQTTQNKIAFKTQVLNSNAKASQVAEFGNGLADHYTQNPKYDLDSKTKNALELGMVFAESATVGLWDRDKGEPLISDESGKVRFDGDMDYFNITPLDDIINTAHQSRDQRQWRIVRRWINKYDLAAKYPGFAETISGFQDTEATYGTKLVTLIHHDRETIPIFYFFHDRTAAVPRGRFMVFADPSCVLEDGPLERSDGKGYDHIPVYDFYVSQMAGSPFGYTVLFDLIPIQQTINELASAVTTNNINFAVQCILSAKGSGLHHQNLAGGMNLLEFDPKMGELGKPSPLNMTSSAPETYKFIDMLIQQMEIIAGINSLQRGQPDQNITSGQYAALVTTQSVLFNNGLQKAYARYVENVMTGTIKTLRKNMVSEKVAQIVGANGQAFVERFQAQDLQDIENVTVQLVNPMLQTPAGKMQMAETLLKSGLIKDPQEFVGVYADGDLPNLYHRQETQLRLVKEENEALMNGEQLKALVTDNHVMHILEHTPVVDTIEARKNPNTPSVIAALAHIQSHLDMLAGNEQQGPINPVLAGIIGDPTLPPGTPSKLQLPPVQAGGVPPPPGAMPQAPQKAPPMTPAQPPANAPVGVV